MPGCDVSLVASDARGPFGVFGYFDNLSIIFDRPLQGKQIVAQDLAGDEAIDISRSVQIRENTLRIPGEVIRNVGLSHATPGDLSAPGMVIAVS
jgi:hypothetical protein